MKVPMKKAQEVYLSYTKKVGKTVFTNQYTSASLDKEIVKDQILKDLHDEVPFLFKILMKNGSFMGNNFYLNCKEYSLYPKEQEVLLDDGVGLIV